jgi:hypothetical protein
MGRVMAPAYDEVVADRLYPGNLRLHDTLPHLVEALEKTLAPDIKESKQGPGGDEAAEEELDRAADGGTARGAGA